MRFFTFVAFMLPLSALAAPTPASTSISASQPSATDLAAQIDEARARFAQAFGDTSLALNATIDQLSVSKDSRNRGLLKTALKANKNLGIAFTAALNIDADVQAGKPPLEADQLNVAKGTIQAQAIIKGLDEKVKKIKDKDNKKDKLDLDLLRKNTGNARDGVDRMVKAGVDILGFQGKSVRQLFENAGLPVPPGF